MTHPAARTGRSAFPLPDSPDAPQPGPDVAAALPLLRRGVWLIGFRELGQAALADDVAQETIVRLFDALARSPDGVRDLAAFARGIARHVIADMRAAERRAVGLDVVENAPGRAVDDPLHRVVREEQVARVRAAMATLSRRDYELLRTLYGEDLKPGALASRLGESAERLRKRKSRALERLRSAFHGHERPGSATGNEEEP